MSFEMTPLKPGIYTGDKVEFNTVDFVESRHSRPCRFGPVPYTLATKSTESATKLNVSATKSTVTATVDFVADLLPVSATVDFQRSRPC